MAQLLSVFSHIDSGVVEMLKFILALLIFFTVLFSLTKKFAPMKKNDEILLRVFSWWIIFFLYIIFFCFSKVLATAGLILLSTMALREFFKILNDSRITASTKYLCYLFNLIQFCFGSYYKNVQTIFCIFVVCAVIKVLLFEREQHLEESLPKVIFGYLLCCFGLQHLDLVHIHSGSYSSSLLLYFIFLVQFNDVLQFLWGTAFGGKVFVGKKFAPTLSPNKTWEGFLGGFISTIAMSIYWGRLTSFNLQQTIILGAVFSCLGLLGDLVMSAFKRNHKLSETGHVIPGHGGILDRVDSLILNSIVFYYVIFGLK